MNHSRKNWRFLGSVRGDLKERLDQLESQIIRETLTATAGQTRAASELGLSRVGLCNKLVRYGLEPKA